MKLRLAVLAMAVFIATPAVLFGTSALNNIHNRYLRFLSTWTVKLTNEAGISGATGFIVKGKSGNKYIMTNSHVCAIGDTGPLYAEYQGERFQVEVYKKFLWNDLCAIKAHRPLGNSVSIAKSSDRGENTWVIGHPLLEPRSVAVGELSGTVFISLVYSYNPAPGSCVGPTYKNIDTSQSIAHFFGVDSVCVRTLEANASTMSIQPGNSGSPAVNLYGNVVAVAFAANDSGTRSYFVPLQDLKDFLEEL